MLLSAAAALALSTPAQAEAFGMRPGAWEITSAMGRQKTALVETACITRPDLLSLVHSPDTIEDDPCRLSGEVRSSKRRWAANLRCQDGSQMHAEFTADGPDRISGTMLRLGGKHTLTQRVDYKGRWLNDKCSALR